MQTERDDQPASNKPASRPTMEAEGEPVSLRDIEMILAPGVAPPPLPTLAKAPSKLPAPKNGNGNGNGDSAPAAGAPKSPAKWSAEAGPLRRRKERTAGPSAPDAVFQRFTPGPDDTERAKAKRTIESTPPPARPEGAHAKHALPHAVQAPEITEVAEAFHVTLEEEEAAPPSGLLDVRNMVSLLDGDHRTRPSFDDDVLNLTGGIMGVDPTSPLLSPLPPPIDDGPRADEDEVLSLPNPGAAERKLIAPVIPLGAEEEVVDSVLPLGDPDAVLRAKPKAEAPRKTPAKGKTRAAAPAPVQAAPPAPAPAPERSKLPWVIAAAAVGVAAWLALRPAPVAPPAPTPPVATTPAATEKAAAAPSEASTALAPTPAPAAAADPSAASTKPAETAAKPVETAAKPAETATKPPAPTGEVAKPEAAKPPATPPPATTPEAAPAPPPAASGPEFDKAAANAALGSAAGAAAGCRAPDDPSGTARVSVKFAPSGRVTSALVNGPPFAGTPTGSCIAKAFRGITVPPFSGDAVTVSKSITIR